MPWRWNERCRDETGRGSSRRRTSHRLARGTLNAAGDRSGPRGARVRLAVALRTGERPRPGAGRPGNLQRHWSRHLSYRASGAARPGRPDARRGGQGCLGHRPDVRRSVGSRAVRRLRHRRDTSHPRRQRTAQPPGTGRAGASLGGRRGPGDSCKLGCRVVPRLEPWGRPGRPSGATTRRGMRCPGEGSPLDRSGGWGDGDRRSRIR